VSIKVKSARLKTREAKPKAPLTFFKTELY
jgi:hypothetical protein